MTGHLRLYWIRTSCKRYKYERHFYGTIISVHSFWKDEMYIGDISEMMDNLGCITDGNNIVPITAAMGYAVQNDNSTKDINEIIHEADSRMYEKKRSMEHRKA